MDQIKAKSNPTQSGSTSKAFRRQTIDKFEEIKRLYFPRWDRLGKWRVNPKPRRKALGYCDTERKVIDIRQTPDDPEVQERVLIHEICHAVASTDHGDAWQRCMEEAAVRAESLGRERLAQLIREDIVTFREAVDGEQEGYESVEHWVMERPDLTLPEIRRKLASEYGLLLRDVRSTYRRLGTVFRQAKAAAIRIHAAQRSHAAVIVEDS